MLTLFNAKIREQSRYFPYNLLLYAEFLSSPYMRNPASITYLQPMQIVIVKMFHFVHQI